MLYELYISCVKRALIGTSESLGPAEQISGGTSWSTYFMRYGAEQSTRTPYGSPRQKYSETPLKSCETAPHFPNQPHHFPTH